MDQEQKFNKTAYDNDYIRKYKDRISFVMDKGTKDRILLAVDKTGCKSAAEYIRNAIERSLYADGIPKSIVIASDLEGQEAKKEK